MGTLVEFSSSPEKPFAGPSPRAEKGSRSFAGVRDLKPRRLRGTPPAPPAPRAACRGAPSRGRASRLHGLPAQALKLLGSMGELSAIGPRARRGPRPLAGFGAVRTQDSCTFSCPIPPRGVSRFLFWLSTDETPVSNGRREGSTANLSTKVFLTKILPGIYLLQVPLIFEHFTPQDNISTRGWTRK